MSCKAALFHLALEPGQTLHSAEWQRAAMGQKPGEVLRQGRVEEEDLERQNKKKGNLVVPPHDGFAQRSLG